MNNSESYCKKWQRITFDDGALKNTWSHFIFWEALNVMRMDKMRLSNDKTTLRKTFG